MKPKTMKQMQLSLIDERLKEHQGCRKVTAYSLGIGLRTLGAWIAREPELRHWKRDYWLKKFHGEGV